MLSPLARDWWTVLFQLFQRSCSNFMVHSVIFRCNLNAQRRSASSIGPIVQNALLFQVLSNIRTDPENPYSGESLPHFQSAPLPGNRMLVSRRKASLVADDFWVPIGTLSPFSAQRPPARRAETKTQKSERFAPGWDVYPHQLPLLFDTYFQSLVWVLHPENTVIANENNQHFNYEVCERKLVSSRVAHRAQTCISTLCMPSNGVTNQCKHRIWLSS